VVRTLRAVLYRLILLPALAYPANNLCGIFALRRGYTKIELCRDKTAVGRNTSYFWLYIQQSSPQLLAILDLPGPIVAGMPTCKEGLTIWANA
jgi:hypothetical protein